MKSIKQHILERLFVGNCKMDYTTTLGEFAELLFTDLPGRIEWYSEDNIYDSWLLPYEINGVEQDTNPDNWEEDDISDITSVLYNNMDTEICIDIEENKPLDAWNYYFDIVWGKSTFKFCWVSKVDLRNKI